MMELSLSNTLLTGDPRLVDHIVGEVKSQGIFDQFRKECIADVDTKPAYQNLRTRVEGSVNSFLSKQSWKPDLNKNQLRETLRKHIHEASYLDAGVERIVDQVVNPKAYSVFMPQIEDVVYKFLGLEKPKAKEKNGMCGLKDLLPKDLDPVSPESDKNSLKDVSLESIDALEGLEVKKEEKLAIEQKLQDDEFSILKHKDNLPENGLISSEEKALDDSDKNFNKTGSNLNLNTSGRSDDKTEEDEEDSPTFEPIDIMNLNESNISNDSHLSGISELTSHRSRSPDFCNELSRDNFDYGNQDSQLSKVSSDSRLSIVTDFGSSNHALTPVHDALKVEVNRDKCDVKNVKDNFKAVREFDSSKNKNNKNIFEFGKNKDLQETKDSKNIRNSVSSKENSRDATDSAIKDKCEQKNSKDRSRDNESKSKSKDKIHVKDGKHHRDHSSEKKKERSHSSSKCDKYDKIKSKDKTDQPKENMDKIKDLDKDNYTKAKEDKIKETEKKDNSSKEGKDLKDLYKEKIRELREKKELTEKEKLNKDIKESKSNKENKDKKDSLKDKKPYKKDHKNSSKTSTSSSHDTKTKSSEKIGDSKEKRSESKEKDRSKRDERRSSKDHTKSKNHLSTKSDSVEKLDKDAKKLNKNEKEEKIEKSEIKKDIKSKIEKLNGKKDGKSHTQNKSSTRNEKADSRKEGKTDSLHRDKRRREEKKSKTKDDHSSLRRNSNDRRSTDRDGSNGSSSKSSQSNNSGSTVASKSGTSSFSKETNHMNNSGSETSDNIEEVHTSNLKLSVDNHSYKLNKLTEFYTDYKTDDSSNSEMHEKLDSELNDANLPLKKRRLSEEGNISARELDVKKPKFAKNIHEAKKLMKIRKQIEKQKLKESRKVDKKVLPKIEQLTPETKDNVESMPDEERVQIIEIPDEEYEEPYPEKHTNLTLEERSIIMLQTEAGAKDLLETHSNLKFKLSDMELCIRQSLSETLPHKPLENESSTYAGLELQTIVIDSNGTGKLQNKESLPAIIEETDSNRIKAGEIENSSRTCSKAETQQKKSTYESEKNITHLELNYRSDDTDKNEIKEQANLSSDIYTDTNSLHSNKNMEVPSTSKFKSEDVSREAQISSSNLDREITDGNCSINFKQKSEAIQSTSTADTDDCRYFRADNEKSEKFCKFLESLKSVESSSLEEIIESLGGQVVSSMSKAMAPPLPKRKHSSSPLTDIILNNSNNNNDGPKKSPSLPNEEVLNNIKRRKLIPPKKQRLQPNICVPQGLLNGENFVMPLSPESDVSATSEKIPSSNLIKEDKGRHRSSQRYSSDDLYKPRPLFSSSSRRSRRSNQV